MTEQVPERDGWYVLNVQDALWSEHPSFGRRCMFEKEGATFEQIGINIAVLQPGQPACRYHRESAQENFLVLSGECSVLINGEERPLKAWDFVHCPSGTTHVFVGGGDGPCAILNIGARPADLFYPAHEKAKAIGAEAPEETADPRVAYSDVPGRAVLPGPPQWPL